MPTYLMLSRLTPEGVRIIARDPDRVYAVRKEIEALDAKVIQQYALNGPWDFVTMLEAPDNVAAFRVAMERESSGRVHTDIFPAIDLDLFSRLMGQTTETVGPFEWQTSLWAQVARRFLRYDTLTRTVRTYCKPMVIEGRENLKGLRNPAIFIGNHSSHMDAPVLFNALPERFKLRVAFGGAADRWFLKGRKGIKISAVVFRTRHECVPDSKRRRAKCAQLCREPARQALVTRDPSGRNAFHHRQDGTLPARSIDSRAREECSSGSDLA